jgi:uncharacterized membrane-anchored protein YjiN (DUF445 family)
MSEQKLRKEIERLRAEINDLATDDHATRDRLNQLINDIEDRLERLDDDADGSMTERVRESIRQFEAEYPRTTAILNDIMVTLSNMGI